MNERWKELCEQASTEHDPVKLSELVREVTRLLEDKFSKNSTGTFVPED